MTDDDEYLPNGQDVKLLKQTRRRYLEEYEILQYKT